MIVGYGKRAAKLGLITEDLFKLTWFTQYELSTLRPPSFLPALSSAKLFRLRLGLSWVIPWFTGLPYTIPYTGISLRTGCLQNGQEP